MFCLIFIGLPDAVRCTLYRTDGFKTAYSPSQYGLHCWIAKIHIAKILQIFATDDIFLFMNISFVIPFV
jgi:hypothetical protein